VYMYWTGSTWVNRGIEQCTCAGQGQSIHYRLRNRDRTLAWIRKLTCALSLLFCAPLVGVFEHRQALCRGGSSFSVLVHQNRRGVFSGELRTLEALAHSLPWYLPGLRNLKLVEAGAIPTTPVSRHCLPPTAAMQHCICQHTEQQLQWLPVKVAPATSSGYCACVHNHFTTYSLFFKVTAICCTCTWYNFLSNYYYRCSET
jgi:hypothetical protein